MIFNPVFEMERLNRALDSFYNEDFRNQYYYQEYDDTNIYENKDAYIVQFLIPGVNNNDVAIDVNNGIMAVSVKRKAKFDNTDWKELKKERMDYDFTRNLRLSDDTDVEKIEAKISNGFLMIVIPKKPELKQKKITVKVQ